MAASFGLAPSHKPSAEPNPPCGQPLVAGIGRGVVRVVRARLAGHRSGRGEIYFPQDAADDAIVEEPS